MSIQDFIDENTDTSAPTRTVLIIKHAAMITDLKYEETLTIPASLSDEDLQELIYQETQELDGGLFSENGLGSWEYGDLNINEAK